MTDSRAPTICWSDLSVVNVVVTCTLAKSSEHGYCLEQLAERLRNVEFNPSKFAALKLCRAAPFSKGLFFRSGKLVCVGNTTVASAHDSLAYFASTIGAAAGAPLRVSDVQVQNIVGSCRMVDPRWSLDLALMARTLPKFTQYEPEVRVCVCVRVRVTRF